MLSLHRKNARTSTLLTSLAACAFLMPLTPVVAIAQLQQTAPQPDHSSPQPVPSIPGLKVLFGGKPDDLTNWEGGAGKPAKWTVEDGILIATAPDSIQTKELFTDCQLHVEFRVPYLPNAKGQSRGNSGVFLQDRYEMQVLDSFGITDPGSGDCGGVYSIHAPLLNACKPPLQWQTYDIVFRAPRTDPATHKVTELPHVTVFLNGILVQNNVAIPRSTHMPKVKPGEAPPPPTLPNGFDTPGPIRLQWHGAKVAFRNIWIVPLALQGAQHY